MELNKNDSKLLDFCRGHPKTIRAISEHLNIAVKNIWVKVRKLEKEGLLTIKQDKFDKITKVQTKHNTEHLKILIDLLKIIEDSGDVLDKEFTDKAWEEVDFSTAKGEQEGYLTQQAINQLIFSNLIQKRYSLTSEGKLFLKKHSKR